MPVMLWLLVQPTDRLPPAERERAVLAIESFVVRRMAAKYQTRAYGQVFVEVLKAAQAAAHHPGQAVIGALRDKPHGYEWPTLQELATAFESSRYYGPGGINQDRLRMLLGAVDRLLHAEALKTETLTIDYDSLQIEHIIPRSWRTSWPVRSDDPSEQLLAEQRREQYVNWLGNLNARKRIPQPCNEQRPLEGEAC
jgi:Protein of unknown function (DUF1524)